MIRDFIGGPWDGRCVDVPEPFDCYQVAIVPDVQVLPPSEYSAPVAYRIGLYRQIDPYTPENFHWQGETNGDDTLPPLR